MQSSEPVMLITGSRKGIGRHLAEHYARTGYQVIGCSRRATDWEAENYAHFCLDVADEDAVKQLFVQIRKQYSRLDVLLNNAGVASMNHALLTPVSMISKILDTNVLGVFLFCREAAKLMQRTGSGRILNFSSFAVPFRLEGEAIYAASKAAVVSLTQILAREFATYGITVNAVGPGAFKTDLIKGVPEEKMAALIGRQAIPRYNEVRDLTNVVDFFIREESDFVTGQVLYLGGVS